MKQPYLNALALVQRYDKPGLFITMTSNPNWPEVKEHLALSEHVQHRPDIVARVFPCKTTQTEKNEIAGYMYVVEFRKRGLPHAHLLLFLQN